MREKIATRIETMKNRLLPYTNVLLETRDKISNFLLKNLLSLFGVLAPACSFLCIKKPRLNERDDKGEISKGLIQIGFFC